MKNTNDRQSIHYSLIDLIRLFHNLYPLIEKITWEISLMEKKEKGTSTGKFKGRASWMSSQCLAATGVARYPRTNDVILSIRMCRYKLHRTYLCFLWLFSVKWSVVCNATFRRV